MGTGPGRTPTTVKVVYVDILSGGGQVPGLAGYEVTAFVGDCRVAGSGAGGDRGGKGLSAFRMSASERRAWARR
jgi:hypothetical protein